MVKKQVFKQIIEKIEEKTKFLAIFNKYKNMLDNFVDSLNIKLLDMPNQINKKLRNIIFSIENFLTKLGKKIIFWITVVIMVS